MCDIALCTLIQLTKKISEMGFHFLGGFFFLQDYSKWVICRVYERNCDDKDDGTELSCLDEVFLSLDDLDEISLPN